MAERFTVEKQQDFDLEVVLQAFRQCLLEDGSLSVDAYLTAFHELCRFFRLTGRLFGFVARDLEGKMKPIETRRNASIGQHYATLQSMMRYEVTEGIVRDKGRLPSGTRQFLRLHRALEFILGFMRNVRHSDEHAKTAQIASEVYEKTLSKHHPLITRKITYVALYFLPTKKFLIDIMCKQDYDTVHDLVDDVTAEGQTIYDVAQKLYEENNLLDIP